MNAIAHLGILKAIPTSNGGKKGRVSHPAAVPKDIMTVANETSLKINDVYYNPESFRRIMSQGELPTRPGTIINFAQVFPKNNLFKQNEGFGWFPFVHNSTGPWMGLGAQFFTNRPYYDMLQRAEYTDLTANLEYHHKKIEEALKEIEERRNARRTFFDMLFPTSEYSENFHYFLHVYEQALLKKSEEIKAWSSELKQRNQ